MWGTQSLGYTNTCERSERFAFRAGLFDGLVFLGAAVGLEDALAEA